ncbi:MAG TPA: lipopolysaccharide heptosyltransferase II [Candidatus Omnitrophota bacterium]|nr:lipopolysaccharide heptosyltransferase II [Candidatus Omnitrophota bacterium]HPS36129.1 lipopolysaccharide heptosyltransferase II [Candidatus Omnitrophota bacterium]
MKVLQLLPALELGGTERGVVDLAKAMKKEGHETVVISSGGALVAELQRTGIPHYGLPVHQKSIAGLFLVDEIVKIIERERVDVIHARSRVPGWLGWLASRKTGVPFMTTCHGNYKVHPMSFVMGWGKRVIVASHAIGRRMIDEFGVPPDRIRLIPRGVDLSQFPFSQERFEKKQDLLRVLLIGRFSPNKGQVEFLKAVHLLRSRLTHFEALIVGSEGRNRHRYTDLMKKTVHQFGLESCVKILPPTRDVAGLLAGADLLVLPSLLPEPFGRVIIEAGAVGIPVAATWLGGVLDIIDHNENGLLFPPRNIPVMAEVMHELLTDREKAKTFAVRLRRKVEEKFNLNQMVRKTLEVYREVRKKRKILVIKLGAMGDLILVVPSLRMLRERFPDASITLLVDKKLAPIVSACPYFDDMILVDRKKLSNLFYLFKTARRVRQEGFDISIDLHNNKWTHLLAYLGGAVQRFGFARGQWGFLLNRPDKTFATGDTPLRHQFRILSKAGVQKFEDTLELWPRPEDVERMSRRIEMLGVKEGTRFIGFVMGSSPNWPSKRWPAGHFLELAKKLFKKYDARIILIGSPDEAPLGEPFHALGTKKVLDIIGKTSLAELPAIFERLHLVVSGDTAPLHVAAAMNVPTVALFGPTDPKRHLPPGKKIDALSHHLACQPCYDGICKAKDPLACLQHISVEEVFEHCQRLIAS